MIKQSSRVKTDTHTQQPWRLAVRFRCHPFSPLPLTLGVFLTVPQDLYHTLGQVYLFSTQISTINKTSYNYQKNSYNQFSATDNKQKNVEEQIEVPVLKFNFYNYISNLCTYIFLMYLYRKYLVSRKYFEILTFNL